jgi:hypothetical protein
MRDGPDEGQRQPKPERKAPAGKPWLDSGRLALIMLEPAVERMMLMSASRYAISSYCLAKMPDAEQEQVDGLIRGIKARWRANSIAADREEQIAEHAAQIDAALYAAWNQPQYIDLPKEEGGGRVMVTDQNGQAVTEPDLVAIPKLLKLRADFRGLNAPSRHVVMSGQVTSVAAMSPAERQAEIDQLLERRRQALESAQADGRKSLTGKVIDVPG